MADHTEQLILMKDGLADSHVGVRVAHSQLSTSRETILCVAYLHDEALRVFTMNRTHDCVLYA